MPTKLRWDKLLSPKREPRDESPSHSKLKEPADERSPFEQDHDRIVFSLPFRRLARKTQVHPLAVNDHIHNRLTHSIEVASVGRSFGRKLASWLGKNENLHKPQRENIVRIMQAACLIHDIGNPPFGHAGENMIRRWAKNHDNLLFPKKHQIKNIGLLRNDWRNFEGNAQGIRLSSRADNAASGYMRLTYASLGAAIKYPWTSSDRRVQSKHKHNVYSTEKAIFKRLATELGLLRSGGKVARHPLSFLTEAADDICYRVLDLEDAVAIRICPEEQIQTLFKKLPKQIKTPYMPLPKLRGRIIKELLDACWEVFINDYDNIIRGNRVVDLKKELGAEYKEFMDEVSDTYERIFGDQFKLVTEIGAYKLLDRVLRPLLTTADCIATKKSYDKLEFFEARCAELAWGRAHVKANANKNYAWWLSQVMDFVAGMTDNYAKNLSLELDGIMVGRG